MLHYGTTASQAPERKQVGGGGGGGGCMISTIAKNLVWLNVQSEGHTE